MNVSRIPVACAVLAACLTAQSEPTSRPASRPSADVRALLARWADSLRDVRSLRVEFEQVKHLRILRKPRRSHGVTLLRGRRVLMRIDDANGERETELSVDGGEVRLHYPRLKKVEVYPADTTSSAARSPFPLVVDDVEALPRQNHLRVERDGDAEILVVEPRDAGASVRELRIRFEDGVMTRVEQRNARGDRVEMRITKFDVNPAIAADELTLDVPAGTREVRFDAKPARDPAGN